MTTAQPFSSTSSQKAVSISLASVIFQSCPYYFTFNNNIHEFYHIKRKHDYSVVCVSAVSKMLSMITNSLEPFSLSRVRAEAPKKQQMLSFWLTPARIRDAKHTHKQNQQWRLCKRLLVQNTCLKSMEEAVQVLQHMSNLCSFFLSIKLVTNETVYD